MKAELLEPFSPSTPQPRTRPTMQIRFGSAMQSSSKPDVTIPHWAGTHAESKFCNRQVYCNG